MNPAMDPVMNRVMGSAMNPMTDRGKNHSSGTNPGNRGRGATRFVRTEVSDRSVPNIELHRFPVTLGNDAPSGKDVSPETNSRAAFDDQASSRCCSSAFRPPPKPEPTKPKTTPMRRHPLIELLRQRTLVHGRVFDVLEESLRLPSGLQQELVVVDHPGAVAIAPRLPSGELLLVRQYRHAAGEWLTELPAGRLEAGEDPETAARRELEEETGHRAERWEERREIIPAPGFCSERIHLFVADDLVEIPGGGRPADEDEEIELVRARPEEILAGDYRDAKTLVAAALLLCEAKERRRD